MKSSYFKKVSASSVITILALIMLTSMIAITPQVKAQAPADITLNVYSGSPGTLVLVTGVNFNPSLSGVTVHVDIFFGSTSYARANVDSSGGFTVSFAVPDVAAGDYTVTAQDDSGFSNSVATATFTVTTGGNNPTPVPSPTGSPAPTDPGDSPTPEPSSSDVTDIPTDNPDDVKTEGGISMTTIAIIAAVLIAIFIPAALLLSRRGGGGKRGRMDMGPEYGPEGPMEPGMGPMGPAGAPAYGPAPSYGPPPQYGAPAYGAPAAGRYGPPAGGPSRYGPPATRYGASSSMGSSYRPTTAYRPASYGSSRAPMASRYGSSQGYGRSGSSMSTCPSCRRPISGNASSCPYCHTRLR